MTQFYALFIASARPSRAGMAVLTLFLGGRGVFATANSKFFVVIAPQTFATITKVRYRGLSRSSFDPAL